jgi:hypothetical protein
MSRDALEFWTRGQAENPLCHKARHGRVTASKVGAILASHRSGNQRLDVKIKAKQNLARGLVTASTFGPTEAMKHGSLNEVNGVVAYAKRLDENEHVVVGHGLHVHPQHPWLASSPNGVCMKDDGTNEKRLVEIKCPFSRKDDGDFDNPKFYIHSIGNEYQLNMRTSQGRAYYYQIQTNLAILDLPACDLVVWAPGRVEVVRVDRQTPEAEADMIKTLKTFWHVYVQSIIDPDVFVRVEEPEEPMEDIASDAEKLFSRLRRKMGAAVPGDSDGATAPKMAHMEDMSDISDH